MFLETGPVGGPTLLLAHGAGAPMDSNFMTAIADDLAALSVRVLRFEFPYMARRRSEGGKRPPDRMPALQAAFHAALAAAREASGDAPIFIGGKSMGGRVASMIADDARPAGLVCLGYPFHPPGKPDRLRTVHLASLQTRALIVQGERDPLGRRAEVESYDLAKSIAIAWAPSGDHDLKPLKSSGRTHARNIADAAQAVRDFMAAD